MIYKEDCTLPKEYVEQLPAGGMEALPDACGRSRSIRERIALIPQYRKSDWFKPADFC